MTQKHLCMLQADRYLHVSICVDTPFHPCAPQSPSVCDPWRQGHTVQLLSHHTWGASHQFSGVTEPQSPTSPSDVTICGGDWGKPCSRLWSHAVPDGLPLWFHFLYWRKCSISIFPTSILDAPFPFSHSPFYSLFSLHSLLLHSPPPLLIAVTFEADYLWTACVLGLPLSFPVVGQHLACSPNPVFPV